MRDSLGDRMKKYENVTRTFLPIRMPIIVRVDGVAFHSYTRGCERPYDNKLIDAMNKVAIKMCSYIQGAKLAFTQSDEISLLITNDDSYNTQPWFDNNLNKILSVSAAVASSTMTLESTNIFGKEKPAYFDSRVFILSKEDVNNYFHWRQMDCTRNSVSMLAQSLYSHKELYKKNSSELQELSFQKGHNWNNLPTSIKRGRVIRKVFKDSEVTNKKTGESIIVSRGSWEVDNEIPIFSRDKTYIENYLNKENY
jgi:tRNA(His) 5'-end guanylyltransferase